MVKGCERLYSHVTEFTWQEKLKLVQSSSWIGKQQTTLYIATQQPSLMSGNNIKAFLVRLWQKASGQQDDDSFAQHFTVSMSHCRRMQQDSSCIYAKCMLSLPKFACPGYCAEQRILSNHSKEHKH